MLLGFTGNNKGSKRGCGAAAIHLILAGLVALIISAGVPAHSLPPEDSEATLGVVFGDGERTEDIDLYRLHGESEELYLSTFELARIFKATKYWNASVRKLSMKIGRNRYVFTVDTRVVTVDGEPVLLRVPVKYMDGQVMIPLEFISSVLADNYLKKLSMDQDLLVITIGEPQYNVRSLHFEEGEEGTRAVLSLTRELLYHVDSGTPGILRLKIYGGKLNPLKFNGTEGKGLFNRVRAEQTERDAYLFFDVQESANRFKVEFEGVSPEDSLRKLVILLKRGELPEIPDADFAGKKMLEILDEGKSGVRKPVEVVAIDPGHGGVDNGRTGPGGTREKEVNLEVAMMLRRALRDQLGVKVVMTRVKDELVPFGRRVEIANTEGADLFISIHCNGWYTSDVGGFETFFLAPPRTEAEARQAREENASAGFEGSSPGGAPGEDLDFILWDMVQNEFINESSRFAEYTQKELDKKLEIRNRGVKQSGLRVLRGLNMPAILVEMAFLSNPGEETLLHNSEFRRSLVEALVEAVARYQDIADAIVVEK